MPLNRSNSEIVIALARLDVVSLHLDPLFQDTQALSATDQSKMSEDLPRDDLVGGTNNSERDGKRPLKPQYMTVGSGSTSASAAALMASLDNDGVYDGSMSNGSSSTGSSRWNPRLTQDRYTPSSTPLGEQSSATAESERRILASHIHQLQYNQNRVALARAITGAVTLLKDLQQMNFTWPAHYPSISESSEQSRPTSRPGLAHTQSSIGETKNIDSDRPGGLRRAATQLGEIAESSSAAHKRAEKAAPEGLITSKASQEFSILKLDLKLQGLTQSEIAHSMDRKAIASLLDGRINQSVRHLLLLRDRIEDTSSKVLVTGDLNAGKSTFCNALLRRKVLPEDQQPCTSIFCEVLDARENGGIEEVHAVHKDVVYNRHDESSYDVYTLQDLEKIVTDNDKYNQCKVYIKDARSIDQSLLNNGVVDISLIDAPGLNSDSLQTTAVFARQEEIDVVVFVVSAANHFTLSAKEFIWNAAHEKAYIFIVVNGYDNIRDKDRCQRMILEQVANLSPRTFKESSELVHFVSSNAIPTPGLPPGGPNSPGGPGGSGSGAHSGSDGPSGHDDNENKGKNDKGKGKDKEKLQDFEHLETSLRRFVLEKRARSKLAPAKTYLTNMLSDLHYLATVNRDVAQAELDRAHEELNEIEPAYEQSKKASSEATDIVDKMIESASAETYRHTRGKLTTTIDQVAEQDLGIEYVGLLNAFQYAEDIKLALLNKISEALVSCEEDARQQTVQNVQKINTISKNHLGDEFEELSFKSDVMFSHKKDQLARQVDIPVEVWDFFDFTSLWDRQEKIAGTGMALTVASVVGGRLVGGVGWVDSAVGIARVIGANNLKQMIIPGLIFSGEYP